MIEFEPTIEPSDISSSADLSGQICFNAVSRLLSDKDRVAAATSPLEPDQVQSDPYDLLKARQKMSAPTGADVFHFRNTHGR